MKMRRGWKVPKVHQRARFRESFKAALSLAPVDPQCAHYLAFYGGIEKGCPVVELICESFPSVISMAIRFRPSLRYRRGNEIHISRAFLGVGLSDTHYRVLNDSCLPQLIFHV